MGHFSYCFCLSLIHSLWQSAALALIYRSFCLLGKKSDPASIRNILYFLLLNQVILSICTFYIYYTGNLSFYQESIHTYLSALLKNQSYLQTLSPFLMSLYGFMVLFKCVRLFLSWQYFKKRNYKSRIKPSIELKVFTAVKSYQFGIRRKVTLWYSNTITTPLTFGFCRPLILLPVALVNNLSLKEAETLIIHELTHIKNNDYLFNWLLIFCETMYFFNPFMRLLSNQVKLEREKNCDAQVLRFNYPAIGYAETLLKSVQFQKRHTPFILAAVLKDKQLFNRIKFFTVQKNLDFYKKNYTALAFLPLLFMLMFNIILFNSIKNKKVQPLLKEVSFANIATSNKSTSPDLSTKIAPVVFINKDEMQVSKEIHYTIDTRSRVLKTTEQPAIFDELPVENFATPVAISEVNDTREVTIKEEDSETGLSVTKVYQMKIVKGEWKARLVWMLTDCKPVIDSLHLAIDTTKVLYNLQEQ